MKLFVLLGLFLGLPMFLAAQNDDMYFVPSKKKSEAKEQKTVAPTKPAERKLYTIEYELDEPVIEYELEEPAQKFSSERDVDEYNRRGSAYSFEPVHNDTLFLDEEEAADGGGNWTSDSETAQDDYTYTRRIIRFRSPSPGIIISSPLYWDVYYDSDWWFWNDYYRWNYSWYAPGYWNTWHGYYHPWGGWHWHYHWTYNPWWGHPHYHGVWHTGRYAPVRPHSSRREGAWFPKRGSGGTAGRVGTTYSPAGRRVYRTPSRGTSRVARPSAPRGNSSVARPGVASPSRRVRPSRSARTSTPIRSRESAPVQRPTRSSWGSGSRHGSGSGISTPSRSYGGNRGGGMRQGGGRRR